MLFKESCGGGEVVRKQIPTVSDLPAGICGERPDYSAVSAICPLIQVERVTPLGFFWFLNGEMSSLGVLVRTL